MTENDSNQSKHFLLQEATDLMRDRRPDEALSVLAQYLRIHPDSEEGWLLLSYAIKDLDKKIECTERVLAINPDNALAKQRLQKLQGIIPQEFEQKPKSSGFPIWATLGMVIFVGLIILVVGIWGYRALFAAPASMAQVTTQTSQIDAQTTPTPVPTSTPASTATDVPSITPTPSPTLPPTPTSAPLDADTLAQMDEIQIQVAAMRELVPLSTVSRSVISQDAVRPILESIYLEHSTREDVADQVHVLSTLGLIEPFFDLYSKAISEIGEGIGGFYVPGKDELYVIGETFSGIERFVYAHEYTHALTDQHYSLDSVGVYPVCLSNSDRCQAIAALVEGDATYLMYQWLETYGTEDDINDIIAAQYAPLDRTISRLDLPPPYAVREVQFRYGESTEFIDHLYQIGKWQMINPAYETLPQTTEQILHPEKYQVREAAKPVEIPDLQVVLGESWRLLASDTLGELGTEIVLGYSFNGLTRIDLEIAKQAAAGWGGDHYQMYYKGTTNGRVLAAAWTWDTRTDADQFWAAISEYLHLRYLKKSIDHPEGLCWEKTIEENTCIFQRGSDVLWIISPDMETLELIRSQFQLFR